jgi:predicted lipoprotein
MIAACSGVPDRSDVVDAIADEALIPSIEDATTQIALLADEVAAFCSAPGEQALQGAQDQWRLADRAWERAEVSVYYGPAPMLRTDSKVDFEPVSPEGIEELLASDTAIDIDYVDNRSAASRRGLGAIEYLLFQPLRRAGEERRCLLAESAATVAADAAVAMERAWTEGSESFHDVFTMTMESNASLADVVAAQFEILNRETLFELGAALGVTSPEPALQAIQEGPANAAIDRYLGQLQGISDTLSVGGEASLIELIRSRSDDVATQIETRLASAVAGLESVSGSMTQAILDEPDLMMGVLHDLSALRDLIHVDVVSLLDLTLGFSDSDGDSG